MGTVKWTWKDDTGKSHTFKIQEVLYFPQLPVNILSVTRLADQFDDDEGTGINTKRSKSRFYWGNNKFECTINHPSSQLPELPINEGFSLVCLFAKIVGTKVCLAKQHCQCHALHLVSDHDIDETPLTPLNLSDDMFHVGETLLYTNAGHTTYVWVEEIFLDDNAVLHFWVRNTANDELIETTKELLRSPTAPVIV